MQNTMYSRRDPQVTHAWIIGSDLSSLAAAVHLIHDAHVPGSHVHMLFNRPETGDQIINSKGLGSTLGQGIRLLSGTIDGCTAHLLSCVGKFAGQGAHGLDGVRRVDNGRPSKQGKYFYLLRDDSCGIQKIHHPVTHLRPADRKDLLKLMLDDGQFLACKTVDDCFRSSFFRSELWILLSSSFGYRPCHSAMEFQNCLRRYLQEAQDGRMYPPSDSWHVIEILYETVDKYLQNEGVDFWPDTLVESIKFTKETPSRCASSIKAKTGNKSLDVPIQQDDIIIVSLGSTDSGSLVGSNGTPPSPIPVRAERLLNPAWSLWFRLACVSPEFGNPAAFCTHFSESKVESFTVFFDAGSSDLYTYLVQRIGEDSTLCLPGSNWSLCLRPSREQVPTSSASASEGRAEEARTIHGYGLTPEEVGNFIQKPMCCCAGQEILSELLSHLAPWPEFEEALSTTTTIPNLWPLASAALANRAHGDRPCTFPLGPSNIAVIGPFSEVADATVCGLDYGIRSAQIAVDGLMSLHQRLPKVKINSVTKRYGQMSHGIA
ncbi:oleate hydratase [Aspergillus insuetus]